jgi:hypothetical protein
VDTIKYTKRKDGNYFLAVIKDGSNISQPAGVPDSVAPSEIEKYVGKEIAQKIIGGGDKGELSGLDLKVGGEGMKGFYDRILPKEVGKYIKKWGAKVESADVATSGQAAGMQVRGMNDGTYMIYDPVSREYLADVFSARSQAQQALDEVVAAASRKKRRGYKATPAWSFDITPAMREAVLSQGQPLYSMAGPRATTADTTALDRARQMKSEGASRDDVWRETGWWEIVPGQWAFEIDDSKVDLKMPDPDSQAAQTGNFTVQDIVDAPEIFQAYPEIADIPVVYKEGIIAGLNTENAANPVIEIGSSLPMNRAASVILHEMQHAIQVREGFAQGGDLDTLRFSKNKAERDAGWKRYKEKVEAHAAENPDFAKYINRPSLDEYARQIGRKRPTRKTERDYAAEYKIDEMREVEDRLRKDADYDQYRTLTGETESRLVQARRDMTPEQRRTTPPWETLETMLREEGLLMEGQRPEDVLISRYDGDGRAMSMETQQGGNNASRNVQTGDRAQSAQADTGTGAGATGQDAGRDLAAARGDIVEGGALRGSVRARRDGQPDAAREDAGTEGAADAPRSSVTDPATSEQRALNDQTMTTLDHIFSETALEELAMEMSRKGKGVLPENIKMLLPDDDMGFLHAFGLPMWQAKKHKVFGRVVDREQKRREQSSQRRAEMFRDVEAFMKMDAAHEEVFQDMLWGESGIEGRHLGKAEGVIADKFNEVRNAQGQVVRYNGPELEINPLYNEQLEAALRKRFAPGGVWEAHAAMADTVVPIYMDIRRSLDGALLDIYDIMRRNLGNSDNEINLYRNFISTGMHNYFPHNRYGRYMVKAVDQDGNTKYREHFDLNLKRLSGRKKEVLREEGMRRIEELQKKYPDQEWEWQIDENREMPEDVYAFPIPMDAMEQVLKAAEAQIDKGVLNKITAKAMKGASDADRREAADRMKKALSGLLPQAVADTLKERGFSMRSMKRENIPGYEQNDIKKVMYDYITGLGGWSTKIDASKDFSKIMTDLDAKRRPREYKATVQYVQDMLRNQDRIDRWTGNVKSLFFANYLGLNFKTAALNLTQNVIVGVPRLSADIGVGRAMRWYKDAGRLLAEEIGGKGNLSEDAKRMLEHLYITGVLDARYLNEIRGDVSKFGLSATWDKVLNVMGMPMAWSDKFNRASLALAAYEAAVNGQVVNAKTLKKFGLKKGDKFSHDQAQEFASEVTTDAHFVYGKSNHPEFIRSTSVGRAISPMYTFRTFSHNLWNAWINMYQQGGPEARRALGLSLAGTMAIGGLTSVPLYASLLALWNAGAGEDDDPVEFIRKQIPQVRGERPNLMRDIMAYGLPAWAGVNLGGSIKMETPMLPRLRSGDTVAEATKNVITDMFGIPWDFFVERTSRSVESLKVGDHGRALEGMTPYVVKNMMQAVRMATEGATAVSGRPIAMPGQAEPRKLTTSEALGKAIGFQPLSATKAWDLHSSLTRSQGVKQQQQTKFLGRLSRALRDNDQAEVKKVWTEIREWNKKAMKAGEPYKIIRREDIQRGLRTRARPKNYPVQLRGEAMERNALYN